VNIRPVESIDPKLQLHAPLFVAAHHAQIVKIVARIAYHPQSHANDLSPKL
jgi:hypothetical protein